jgi:hypothetical protein
VTAGYSGKPLVTKLGIKERSTAIFLNAPEHYRALLGELPAGVEVAEKLAGQFDFIHFFTKSRQELESQFPALKEALAKNGTLWISWPKAASKVSTDLSDNAVREIGLANGLVDVKIAAVDQTWSGVKFVYRLKDR